MNCTKLCHDEGALPLHLGRVSPFPLGTGNDLSCSLGFGSGFSRWVVMGNSRFRKAFEVLAHSAAVDFDRWNLTITPSGAPSSRKCIKKIMNNYFSVGFDAGCAGHMAHLREKYPKFFITRPVVKLWYAFTAAVSLFRDGKIGKKVILRIDGKEVRLPYNPKAVVVANINSYAGGSTIWNPSTDKERFLVPSSNDGLIEVLCLRGVWHLALARLDLGYGTKLGQGRHVELEISSDLPCQYDGEFIDSLPSLGEKIQLSFDYYTSCEVQQTVPKYTPYFAYIAFFLTVLFVIVSHFL
ncbi:diacylglycerol kinase [Angomonas deanei]|uniref:Diacylglycerol kinase accessory domain containing protein, putative n=1 Tax=Angomonas deanei TaxID=59799 RepID=A0A7G2CMK3_9TRYP|nr:diacylglycerol kinase [Angomonas deanei]CAD2220297.1 Diacylglycerol kinase accessory domain containing protein, putative [Angomonas deanei]|eukprot:EPY41563.1 diacylglycerol kinase [Angomonas deanei]